MKKQTRVILYGIGLSLLYYLFDAVLDHLIFYEELSFLQVFILNPPIQELYTRLLGITAILILSIIVSRLISVEHEVYKSDETTPAKENLLGHDPELMINLSHQIKSPLNAIIGFSELLKDPKLSEVSKELYTNHIHTSGRIMLELINNIADITKLETGQFTIDKEGFRLNKLMGEIHDEFQKRIKEKGKKDLGFILKTGIQDDNFTLLTDKDKLKQIIANLLENSISFTDEGVIEFGYKQLDDLFLEFYVKDSGYGFSLDKLEMILERFKKVIDSRMQPFDTAALRINLSKHFIKLLGGKLRAESKLGQGSSFYFTIPLSTIEIYTKEDVETEEDVKIHYWKDKLILITEDVESNYIYLKEILNTTNVNILWAKNGREAVDMCKKNKNIDLVLMDILMPEMDGYEAAKLIKKNRPDLPIVAQTAYSLEGEDPDTHKNFDKYMIKPIWSNDLLSILSVYLS